MLFVDVNTYYLLYLHSSDSRWSDAGVWLPTGRFPRGFLTLGSFPVGTPLLHTGALCEMTHA